MSLSVRENAAVSALKQFTRGPLLSRQRELAAVQRELEQLDVKTPSTEAAVAALSGGNQQKVVLARALLSQPGHPDRRRADPGRGRRGAGRDLPDPARCLRRRRPRGRGVLRRQGARRTLRPRHRHVARAGRRRTRRRRDHRGADRQRGRALHGQTRVRRTGEAVESRRRCCASSRATTPRRSFWSSPSSFSAATSCPATTLPESVQHHARSWSRPRRSASSRSGRPSRS